jgi:hypothetical protein
VPDLSRSEFLKLTGVGIAGMVLPGSSLAGGAQESATVEVTVEQIKTALKLANLSFADDEVKEMVGSVKGFGENWPALREHTKDAGFMGMNWRVVPETIGSSGAPVRSLNMRSLDVYERC